MFYFNKLINLKFQPTSFYTDNDPQSWAYNLNATTEIEKIETHICFTMLLVELFLVMSFDPLIYSNEF